MIKSIVAHTAEVDDKDAAVAEILAKVQGEGPLLKNSVGLIYTVPDFIHSGVAQAVSTAFPFAVVGTTTIAALTADTDDPEMSLTLTILTSDDVNFIPALTEPFDGEDDGPIRDAYGKAVARAHEEGLSEGESPKLILSYVPLLNNVGGDFFVNSMAEISGGVPNFGTLSVDNTIDYAESSVLYEGGHYRDRYAFVLLTGEVDMKFHIATLPAERVFSDRGVITDVSGNLIKAVNDIPVSDYLVSLGLKRDADGVVIGVNVYPFVVDFGDGSDPVIRVLFAITPEGYAVCGGNVPQGAVISVGYIDADIVVEATTGKLDEIIEEGVPGTGVMLAFSCIGRYLTLGYNSDMEMNVVRGKLGAAGMNYSFMYSGGEICPVKGTGMDGERGAGSAVNRFHNDTFTVLTLS
ncbi:MAG: FIST C-terminal domain-containing protein [Clostridiales Family XIII bacterium]|jgi:hypothetical protein|nr:FIST C-terminal domain-containing protein [Clostridiales Family XIII bacterium]